MDRISSSTAHFQLCVTCKGEEGASTSEVQSTAMSVMWFSCEVAVERCEIHQRAGGGEGAWETHKAALGRLFEDECVALGFVSSRLDSDRTSDMAEVMLGNRTRDRAVSFRKAVNRKGNLSLLCSWTVIPGGKELDMFQVFQARVVRKRCLKGGQECYTLDLRGFWNAAGSETLSLILQTTFDSAARARLQVGCLLFQGLSW